MAILKTDELHKSSFNRSDHLLQVKKDMEVGNTEIIKLTCPCIKLNIILDSYLFIVLLV